MASIEQTPNNRYRFSQAEPATFNKDKKHVFRLYDLKHY